MKIKAYEKKTLEPTIETKYRVLHESPIHGITISQNYYRDLKEFADRNPNCKPIHLIAETAKGFSKPSKTTEELTNTDDISSIYRCHKKGCCTPCYVIRCTLASWRISDAIQCVCTKSRKPEFTLVNRIELIG
jgi:hypothetical protein